MPSLPFTWRQLQMFSSLSTTRSFRQTAEDFHISQASVSGQIKALEQQLGATLIRRHPGKRTSSLTPAGAKFLEDLRAFEKAAAKLAMHRRQTTSSDEPLNCRIRTGQVLFDRFIRPKLGEFLAKYPQIELDIDAKPPGVSVVREVSTGRFDFALFHIRSTDSLPSFIQPLTSVRGGIYGHRKFAMGKTLPLSPEEISELPFLLPQEGSELERSSLVAMREFGIIPKNIVCHSTYFDVQASLMASGIGVTSFSDALLSKELRRDVILLYPMFDWQLAFFRKSNDSDRRLQAIEEFLISSVLNDKDYPSLC